MPPLNAQHRAGLVALEAELLSRIAVFPSPVALWRVFEFSDTNDPPQWAVEASERLLLAGKLRELQGGLLEVIEPDSAPILRAA